MAAAPEAAPALGTLIDSTAMASLLLHRVQGHRTRAT